MNKKGAAPIAIVAIVLALTILGIFLISIAGRECNSNSDCATNAYCGVDYECHQFPDEIVVKQNNFLPASIIFGLSIITASLIYYRTKKNENIL